MHGAQCNSRNAQAPRGSSEPAIRRASSPPLPCREVIHARLESVHRGQPIWMCWFYGFLGAQSTGSGPNPLPGDGMGALECKLVVAPSAQKSHSTRRALQTNSTTKPTTDNATKGLLLLQTTRPQTKDRDRIQLYDVTVPLRQADASTTASSTGTPAADASRKTPCTGTRRRGLRW